MSWAIRNGCIYAKGVLHRDQPCHTVLERSSSTDYFIVTIPTEQHSRKQLWLLQLTFRAHQLHNGTKIEYDYVVNNAIIIGVVIGA